MPLNSVFRILGMFEYRPDLKGIKTLRQLLILRSALGFEYRPDLKGIKTLLDN